MEEPVFIKCEPEFELATAEWNNTEHDMKLPTEGQIDLKTEPEDVFYNQTIIKDELEIQDVKIEACNEENDASGVSLNENQTLPTWPEVLGTSLSSNQMKFKSPVRCICGRWLKMKHILKQHILKHIGEKSYECPVCCSQFKLQSALNAHLRLHSDYKPYKCSHCKKAFATRHYLERHMIVHTGICITCGMTFSQREDLTKHCCINS